MGETDVLTCVNSSYNISDTLVLALVSEINNGLSNMYFHTLETRK